MPRTPISGTEQQLARWAGEDITPREPMSRIEKQLARIAGDDIITDPPMSPEEEWLEIIYEQGGGTPSGKITITQNGTDIDVAQYAYADVAVPQPAGKITITQNGTDIDVAAYATADVAIPQDHTVEDAILDRSLSGAYTNDRLTEIGAYAFRGCAITSASFANVTAVNGYAFDRCVSLVNVELRKVSNISNNAFSNCTSLVWLSFDDVTEVPRLANTNAFTSCPELAAIYLPDDLVTEAQGTTNWVTYASLIKPLSQKPTS